MSNHGRRPRLAQIAGRLRACLLGLAAALAASPCRAGPSLSLVEDPPPLVLSQDAAVVWALQHNPELAAVRQQHGIAAAAVVIARTYPYNPTLASLITYATGPPGEVTNAVPNQHALTMPVELRGQGAFRRETADAALSRTDWEIATQELALVVRVVRAYRTVLYWQAKLGLVEDTVRLNQQVADQARRLVEQGKLRGADLIQARTEVDAARAQLGTARSALAAANAELYRAIGVAGMVVTLEGTLGRPEIPGTAEALVRQALQARPDLRARKLAIAEAEARLRLTEADRYGNPSVGPFYEQDNTRVNYVGIELNVPVPVCNTRRGEIEQRQAEAARTFLELRRTEVQVQQDVEAALARLDAARATVQTYQTEVIPNLESGLQGMLKLFQQAEPGVDALRVIDQQRKLLRGRDGYLDALWEAAQGQADLIAAVGDPSLGPTACTALPPAAPTLPQR